MRKFNSMKQAQRFLNTHAAIYNLFNLGRHLISAENHRCFDYDLLRLGKMQRWFRSNSGVLMASRS
jgi:hypothetical protein